LQGLRLAVNSRSLVFVPLLMLVACGAGGDGPLQSFETRCAALPKAQFDVVEVPVTFVEDESQSIDELTIRSGDTPEARLTFGLTTANFGHQTDFELRSVDDPGSGRACGTPSVHVRLSMQPMKVFVADELATASCPRAATFSHEMQHVAVFRQTLGDAARDLRDELPGKLGTGLQRASNQAELERQFKAAVQEYLSAFIHRWHGALTERQAAVDSPTEYARVRNACP
jgi:hypothetical protein